MRSRRLATSIGTILLLSTVLSGCFDSGGNNNNNNGSESAPEQTPMEALGEKLFFDANLSSPPGQACASCHEPDAGFADPDQDLPVSKGVIEGRFGNRNAPTAAYAAFIPEFHYDQDEGLYVGGQFLDGRAKTLEEQAEGPFLNPLEMANPDEASLVDKVHQADYAELFEEVFDAEIWNDTERAYEGVTEAIASFERTPLFSPFSSKYDLFLAGDAELTPQEQHGLEVFEAEDKGNCAACHPSQPDDAGNPPLFTDHTYDNLGVPANPDNPFYDLPPDLNPDGEGFVDFGLGTTVTDVTRNGKFKVPTLRNIDLTAPYMHNGVFTDLKEVVNFYNTRDIDSDWPPAEVADNVNHDELGDLGLSKQEEDDLVAFLKTLSDGYDPRDK